MGKNIKSYATIPCPFPWEREGSLTAKVLKSFALNMVRLNRTHYSHLKFTARLNRTHYSHLKFTNKIFQFSKLSHKVNSSKLCRFRAVRPHSPRITQNSHFVNLFYIMFQAPAPAKNPAEFQRITQIPRNSPTQSANDAKFAPFINIIHYFSDA